MNASILLTIQSYVALVSFLVGSGIVGIVIFLITSTNPEKEEDAKEVKALVYGFRKKYFLGILLVAAAALILTLRGLPYYAVQKAGSTLKVGVVGQQWLWRMAEGGLPAEPGELAGGPSITLPANKAIEFEVTAIDANHAFGIYNSEGAIVAQTQTMPGYINHLVHTFEPGKYEVLCLEYCGIPHAIMTGEIIVE